MIFIKRLKFGNVTTPPQGGSWVWALRKGSKAAVKQPGLLLWLWLLLTLPVYGQNGPEEPGTIPPAGIGEAETLPRTFREISLGMNLEALKKALERDGLFYFRGDRDVSFLPVGEQSLVETTGFSFIRRAFFQLREGELFIMAFSLDPALIDHYSVFTAFVKKYGEPLFLDPGQAVWESEDTRIAIERPLTVKYIDKRVFTEIMGESAVRESAEVFLREEFLDGF
ncbi:MAG: hypothetical protein LBC60_07445 [Spirochaetaceae bacterium]|jgi:hypothetical protein|nr:hypothetical protein [Spirochaetaceae bacterium]